MAYDTIIARMTLEEKAALLAGASAFGTRVYPSLGVPELQFSDGPHGMRHQDPEIANHLGIGGSLPATCFPTAVTVANSWDPALGEQLGEALAEEAAAQGVSVVLGPGLNIKRSPLCGRNFEYFSEDPLLAGKMAAAYVRGIQSRGIAACPKHFAVNSQETRRQASDSIVDERTLRELYLAGFETAVRESGPKSIMSSYNLVNGTYANEDPWLLTFVLRDEWGFKGSVITDWGGSNSHVGGVAAGSTFEMPAPGHAETRALVRAVRAGELSEATVDARVAEALDLILSTRPAVEAAAGKGFDTEAHHQLARSIAAQGIVLLKNDAPLGDANPLLPLAPATRVALIGDFATTPRYQGAGSSLVNCTKLDTLADAVAAEKTLALVGVAQGFERDGGTNPALVDEAVKLASSCEVALVCLGLPEVAESEGIDRSDIRLNDNQVQLLAAVVEVNPRVVVLLSAGAQVDTSWIGNCASLLYLALGGQAGASAAVDVLVGRVNPSGKLAETWVRSLSDTPTAGRFPSQEKASEYREGLYVGYRYHQTADVPVAFPFGFGLSYTSFSYDNLKLVGPTSDETGDGASVTFTLRNTGARAGAEVVQLYVAKPEHEVFRPAQQLVAFAKVALEPGEEKQVELAVPARAFAYWNMTTRDWEVEAGTYALRVGASCEDIRLTVAVELLGTAAPNPYEGKDVGPYETGQVAGACVSDAQFSALLGRPLREPQVTIDETMCFRDLNRSRSLLLRGVAAVLTGMEKRALASGTPNLNVEFIYNMPLRAIGIMAGGLTDAGLVHGVVMLAKGWGWLALAAAVVVKLLTKRFLVLTFIVLYLLPVVVPFVANLVQNRITEASLRKADASR